MQCDLSSDVALLEQAKTAHRGHTCRAACEGNSGQHKKPKAIPEGRKWQSWRSIVRDGDFAPTEIGGQLRRKSPDVSATAISGLVVSIRPME